MFALFICHASRALFARGGIQWLFYKVTGCQLKACWHDSF